MEHVSTVLVTGTLKTCPTATNSNRVCLPEGSRESVSIEFSHAGLKTRDTAQPLRVPMNHTTPNKSSPLRERFLRAADRWMSPDRRPDVTDFANLWFGSNCALLNYTAETAGEFDDETQKCLSNLLALQSHQHAEAAKKWLQRANGFGHDTNVPSADVAALANMVIAIVHGIAAVYRWRESRWGNDTNATESIREQVKTCWRSYTTALPVDGPPMMHDCNLYLNPTKLSGLMALLNEPTTATHWLMLQRLFAYLLQNAPDDQPTRTRSASEATETIGPEKSSLARRVSMPATAEHEVRTHLVGVALHGETRPLTVSRVAEGPSGWYLDPVSLGATRIAPEILKQLNLSWRVVRYEQTPPLRIAIPSDGLPSLTGPSAGGLLLLSMHAAATSGFLREDSTASFDIQPAREFQENERIRLSDITAINVEPSSVWKKAHSLTAIPPTNRLILAHNQTDNHTGNTRAWETWTTAARAELRVECVPIQNAQEAWQEMSGGPQIEAVEKYLADIIHYADTVPPYFPPGTELPNVRVQVRVRTELFRPDDFSARLDERERLSGSDPRRIYSHRLNYEEEQREEQKRGPKTEEIVLDWDSQIRSTLRRGLLLGDPGLGKSWLQKHEACALATTALEHLANTGSIHSVTLPVLLPLSDLASVLANRQPDQSRDLLSVLRTVLLSRAVGSEVINQIAETWGTVRCVLLLDAWDEVEQSQQPALRRCLEEWSRAFPQGRVLLTSRIVGRPEPFWPTTPGSETEREMELQPFGDLQTREFIERFFTALPPVAAALIHALPQAPQLRGLAQIPLLLSFLCRYAYDQLSRDLDQHHKNSEPEGVSPRASGPRSPGADALRLAETSAGPDQESFELTETPTLDLHSIHRNDLYRYILTQFLKGVWHPDRPALDDTAITHLLELLAHNAYHLLKEGYQKFSLSVFEDKLADALRHSARGFAVSKSEFDELRHALIGQNGLVIPASVGPRSSYLFLHLTFQEFLAAQFLKSLPESQLETILGSLWDHPAWQEVWDLMVQESASDPQRIEFMVATIHKPKHQHPLDGHLQRHRLTALRWLIIARLEPNNLSLTCTKCIQWAINVVRRQLFTYGWDSLLDIIFRTYGRLSYPLEQSLIERLDDQKKIVRRSVFYPLVPFARSGRDQTKLDQNTERAVRNSVVHALSTHAGNEHVQAVLLSRINDVTPDTHCSIIRGLAPYADNERVQNQLLTQLDYWDRDVRTFVVQALAPHAGSEPLQTALLTRLDDVNSYARDAAVQALASYAGSKRVQTALLSRIDDRDWNVRKSVAEVLSRHASNEHVQNAFLARLDYVVIYSRESTVQALARYVGSKRVQTALLSRIDDQDWNVRKSVVEVLSRHASNEHVQNALLARLNDVDYNVRNSVVQALAPYAGSKYVQTALLTQLNDRADNVRKSVVQALAPHAGSEFLQTELLARLDDFFSFVRVSTVQALAPFAGNKSVQTALLARLDDKDPNFCCSVASALMSHAENANIQKVLFSILRYATSRDLRFAAVKALAPYAKSKSVPEALLARLGDEDEVVRGSAANALTPHAECKRVQTELLSQLNDVRYDVRKAVAIALRSITIHERHGNHAG